MAEQEVLGCQEAGKCVGFVKGKHGPSFYTLRGVNPWSWTSGSRTFERAGTAELRIDVHTQISPLQH
jgi:hypothetical protein